MATTPNWNIVYPVVGTTMTPLANHFANLANSTDAALVSITNTVDTNLTSLSAKDGLVVVQPTSVVGAGISVSSDGVISGSSLTAANYDFLGLFSADFRHYKILMEVKDKAATTAPGNMWYLSGTTPLTSNVYGSQWMDVTGGTVSSGSGNYSSAIIASDGVGKNISYEMTLFSPFFTDDQRKLLISHKIGRNGSFYQSTATISYEAAGVSVTGIRWNPGQAVASFRLRVYGYN